MHYIINTFLGFLLAQLYDVFNREKESEASPKKFDLLFFLKDTWQKIVVSLLLSSVISFTVHYNTDEILRYIGKDWDNISKLIYLVIGFAPEIILQWFKKKYGVLQPKNVDEYKRKQ